MNSAFQGILVGIAMFVAGALAALGASDEEKRLDELLGTKPAPTTPAASADPSQKSKEEQDLDKLLGTQPTATTPAVEEKPKGVSKDAAVEPGSAEKEGSGIGFREAYDKAKWTLSATSYGFASKNPQERPGDDPKNWQNYSRLTMDTWLPVNGDFDIKIDLAIEVGTEDHERNLEDPFRLDEDNRTRYVDFNQLYIKKKAGDFDLIFGKQRLDLAVNTLYSPCDRISPIDGNHPFDPYRLGVPQVAAIHYAKSFTTEFHFIPFLQENKSPPPTSRWSASDPANAVNAAAGGALASQFANNQFAGVNLQGYSVPANGATADTSIDSRPDLPNFLLREKYIAGSVDYYASLYYGFLPDYTLPVNGTTIFRSHTRGWMPGLAAATTVGKFELHGEMTGTVPKNGKSDTYLNPCLGVEYDLNNLTNFEEIDSAKFALEYAYEWVLEQQYNQTYPVRLDQIRPGRNTLFAGWKIDIQGKHEPFYGMIYNIRYNDYSQRVGYKYKCKDGLSFELSYEWFDGPFDTLLGQGRYNNCFIAQAVKKF